MLCNVYVYLLRNVRMCTYNAVPLPCLSNHSLSTCPSAGMADPGKSICRILRDREIYGSRRRLTQTTVREMDLSPTRNNELLYCLDEDNLDLADRVLSEYKDKLTTTGVTTDDILEVGRLDQLIRPFLLQRYHAIGTWWGFFEDLVHLRYNREDENLNDRLIDCKWTVNCAADCERSVESIIKSQRFRELARRLIEEYEEETHSEKSFGEKDDEDYWWSVQLTELFEQHKYNL